MKLADMQVDNMIEDAAKGMLESLLEPLGLKPMHVSDGNYIRISDGANRVILQINDIHRTSAFCYDTYKEALCGVLSNTTTFSIHLNLIDLENDVNTVHKYVSNPYFNCSLEAAMIIKDLLATSSLKT